MSIINPTVIRGPVDVYTAPVATAFTGVLSLASLDPAWKKLGARGYRSQDTGGVTITHKQKIEEWRGENNVIQDAARSEEDILIAFTLADVSMEALAAAMNGNTVTVVAPGASTKGTKKMPLARGTQVNPVALLLVFKSPYVTGEKGILYLPKCFQNADSDIAFNKSNPAMTKFEFKVLEGPAASDTDPDIGYFEVISAAATS
jgi:hypothetical protein